MLRAAHVLGAGMACALWTMAVGAQGPTGIALAGTSHGTQRVAIEILGPTGTGAR